jgi:hypothetical protein
MVVYTFKPEHREAATARFKDTGGPPPEGVKMVGRWHAATMNKGYTLAEANSVETVAMWCHRWADLLSFDVVPVLDDEGVIKVLSS